MSFFFSPTDCELYTANYAFGFYENPGHLFKGQQSKISECGTFFLLVLTQTSCRVPGPHEAV